MAVILFIEFGGFVQAGFNSQKIIYNQHVIFYKSGLSHRITIGQSNYKFKGVFHGEKEFDQIYFQKEACTEKSRGLKECEKEATRENGETQGQAGGQCRQESAT